MTRPRPRDGVDPVMAEATRWFVTLHDDPADAKARPEFEAWREADPRHAAAYARLQQLWGASGHLPSLARTHEGVGRRAVLQGALGAGAAVVLVAGVGRLAMGAHPFADHRTRPGERSTVILVDGSRIELSTATALTTDFSGCRRRIRLLEGEAWFQVAPDPRRPFVVEAAGGSTTALGTAFSVAVNGEEAAVSVTDHAVRVASRGAQARVASGESVTYDAKGTGRVRATDSSVLAWREGRLAFVNRPLNEVVATLDRWTGERTMILDNELGRQSVTLTLGVEHAAEGLGRLAEVTPMRVTRVMPGLTLIRAT